MNVLKKVVNAYQMEAKNKTHHLINKINNQMNNKKFRNPKEILQIEGLSPMEIGTLQGGEREKQKKKEKQQCECTCGCPDE